MVRSDPLRTATTGVADHPPARVRRGSTSWRVVEDWQDRLFADGAPNWLALDADARAECVKVGHLRAIWRVILGSSTVFAKVYERPLIRDRIRWRLTGNPAQVEWRTAHKAAARGVPTIRPLAVGVDRGVLGRSVFLSEGIDGAVSLTDAWEQENLSPVGSRRGECRLQGTALQPTGRLDDRVRHRLMSQAVTQLLAAAHERGFFHPDGHPGNILMCATSDGAIEAAFVDVYPARLATGAVSARRAVGSLAQLNHYFRRYATRAERLRFLLDYLSARRDIRAYEPRAIPPKHRIAPLRAKRQGSAPGNPRHHAVRQWAEAIAARSTRHADQLARQRDRRLRRNGKYFATFRVGGGWVATVVLKLERRHAFPEPDVSDLSREDWSGVLASVPTTVLQRDCAEGLLEGDRLSYSANRLRPLLGRVFYTLTGSPGRKAFVQAHARRHRDLPAELILGYAEHRTAGLIDATVLIRPVRQVEREHDTGGAKR